MKKPIFVIVIIFIFVITGVGFLWISDTTYSKPVNTVQGGINEKIEANDLNTEEVSDVETERKIKVLASGETIGYFDGIEWGDYCHFVVKDLNGELHGFFVYMNFNKNLDIDGYENDPSHQGKKVKVKWQDIETYIPEGGGYYTIRELLNVEEIE